MRVTKKSRKASLERELRSAPLGRILDGIECLVDNVNPKTPRPDVFELAAPDFFRTARATVVAEDKANPIAEGRHFHADRLAGIIVGMADNVGAGFVEGEHDERGFAFAESLVVKKCPNL
jgi:hypothetical protein